jgi:hypothetical protein
MKLESLKLDQFQDQKLEDLKVINGGLSTTYTTSKGGSGTDTWTDTNGDGKMNDGDYLSLDNGVGGEICEDGKKICPLIV